MLTPSHRVGVRILKSVNIGVVVGNKLLDQIQSGNID